LARVDTDGGLIPLAHQDRTLWDRHLVSEGLALITDAFEQRRIGEYQLQAAIAGVHSQARHPEDTDWPQIQSLYGRLELMTSNPMVTLNRAVAVSMIDGPRTGLEILDKLAGQLGEHHRFLAVRAHLLERAGDTADAIAEFQLASQRTANLRERHYLMTQAAHLSSTLQK
jgi:predicted RNA polymerase sigma factor